MKKNSKARKSWRDKFEHPSKDLPRVETVNAAAAKVFGGRRVLIATPRLVNDVVRTVRKGKLVTVNQIRERLAKKFKADCTCPLTTGIFLRILSEVAEEDRREGKKQISPYWRVLKSGGKLNEKYPGGTARQATRLRAEGHAILKGRGVKDYDRHLQPI